jgi:hypothetical protein
MVWFLNICMIVLIQKIYKCVSPIIFNFPCILHMGISINALHMF